MKRTGLVAACVAAVLGSACATVKVDPGRCEKVGSVAIVGYDVAYVRNAPHSDNDVVNVINAAKAVTQVAKGDIARQQQEQAVIAYSIFAGELSRAFGWRIVPVEQVVADPVYVRLRLKYQHKLSNGSPRIERLLGGGAAAAFEPAEQAELARSLGVEAVVALEVGYHRVRSTHVEVIGAGTGHDHLQAVLGLTVMDGGAKPAWRDLGAAGNLSGTTMPVVMGVQTDSNLSEAMRESTVYAVDALFARFQQARAEAARRSVEAAASVAAENAASVPATVTTTTEPAAASAPEAVPAAGANQ